MNIKRLIEIDFTLLISIFLLSIFGILFIYSSGLTSAGVQVSDEYARQIIWVGAGFFLLIGIALIDYRRLYDFSGYLYLAILVILLYTKLFGRVVNGARSWIGIGSFGVQPSEFAKICTILYLAKFLESTQRSKETLYRLVVSGVIVMLPVALILAQPDLGTALVYIPIFLSMSFVAGMPLRYISFISLFIALGGFLTVLPLWQEYIIRGALPFLRALSNVKALLFISLMFLVIDGISIFGFRKYQKKYFYWIAFVSTLVISSTLFSIAARSVLKEYQIMRLIVFLDPEVDPRGSGWNIIQSITAIGSGGVFGKGFLQGTQSHYRFLPQQSTDFIFSIFSEEWGFVGGLIVFALYYLISHRLLSTMKTTADPFGAYICAGIASVIVFHFMINVGMTMGVMPITGIPLLFMSYGGSSLHAMMSGLGVTMSIYMRRFEH